jgi:hypothetical protein
LGLYLETDNLLNWQFCQFICFFVETDMNVLFDITKLINTAVLCDPLPPKTQRVLHPRDALVANLDHNLRFLADPSYTVEIKDKVTGQTKRKAPSLYYVFEGANARITLSYAHEKLFVGPGKKSCLVPTGQLQATLQTLLNQAAQGAFDDQLCAIKDQRAAQASVAKKTS